MEKLRAQNAGTPFAVEQPRPLGRSKWYEMYPKEISPEKWRTCVCKICSQVEGLVDSWGALMSVVHSGQDDPIARGELGRKVNVRCKHEECRWGLPAENPASLTLPKHWPSRFKNMVTRPSIAEALQLELPTLFCSSCGCGCCVEEAQEDQRKLGLEVAIIASRQSKCMPGAPHNTVLCIYTGCSR